ncbi:MAG: hypothetical protein J6B73_06825 [Methanobrevibacter sp.]|uniref:hypothetical protein n=1 Tax=Methanobrevibacter sp. TaxID=66852 RepID=UPI001B0814AB|nr:hypothetical protein [Methanobrevibacter sp.]MBO5151850.1 hypothetical protein [Methanobrevibacter sp.]
MHFSSKNLICCGSCDIDEFSCTLRNGLTIFICTCSCVWDIVSCWIYAKESEDITD